MYAEHDIENLFSKKFEKFEVKSSEEEWSKLSSKLSRSNFLKFSFVTFNVYYLLALLTFAGTATLTGFSSHRLTKKVKQLEQTIETYKKEQPTQVIPVSPLDPVRTNPSVIKTNKSGSQKEMHTEPSLGGKNPGLQGKNASIKVVVPSNKVSAINDTTPNINAEPLQIDTTYHRITKVKKTVFIKKDRVIVKDTITKSSK